MNHTEVESTRLQQAWSLYGLPSPGCLPQHCSSSGSNQCLDFCLCDSQSCFCCNLEPNAFLAYAPAYFTEWDLSWCLNWKQNRRSTDSHTLNVSQFLVVWPFLPPARSAEARVLGLLLLPSGVYSSGVWEEENLMGWVLSVTEVLLFAACWSQDLFIKAKMNWTAFVAITEM